MALAIRLRQQGRKNRTMYRVVVTDEHAPRDGKYVELVGWYNPIESEPEKNLFLKPDRIQHWLGLGAQMSERVESLVQRAAPSIIRWNTDRIVAHKAKQKAKRKARNKAEA